MTPEDREGVLREATAIVRDGIANGRTDEVIARQVLAADRSRVEGLDYAQRVEQMAAALHEDCLLRWQAVQATGGTWQADKPFDHLGRAHDLVRRIFPELDAALAQPQSRRERDDDERG
jgi:hypothetical protein